MSERAPWATLDDVRRMIAQTKVIHVLNEPGTAPVATLFPPQETEPREGQEAGATSGDMGGVTHKPWCLGRERGPCDCGATPDCPDSGPAKADVAEIVQALRDAGFQASGNPLYDRAADMLEAEHEARITAEGDLAIARGPAKEAAPASFSTATTPAEVIAKSLVETATGALSAEEEARRIASATTGNGGAAYNCEKAILALVKREREAAVKRALEALADHADSKGSSYAFDSLRSVLGRRP